MGVRMRKWWTFGVAEVRERFVTLQVAFYGWNAQSTVEYALVGALVVIAGAAALSVVGEQVTGVFTNLGNTLKGPGPSAPR